jgi:dsRNA-specific ribonuclease
LEFLGDSVIGLVTPSFASFRHPEMEQGELSMLKAQFIRTESESIMPRSAFRRYIQRRRSFHSVKEADHVLGRRL